MNQFTREVLLPLTWIVLTSIPTVLLIHLDKDLKYLGLILGVVLSATFLVGRRWG